MRLFRSSILLLFVFLISCSPASIDGKVSVKVNADGSGQYQFSLLTHPVLLPSFQKFKQSLIDQQFTIKTISHEKQVGWIATKNVSDLQNEPLPSVIPTYLQKPSNTKKMIVIDNGFYWKQIVIDYPLDLTPFSSPSFIAKRIHLALVVTLPVPFQEQNAHHLSSDQKTATWQLKVGEINRIYAKVKVPNPNGWLITLVGLLLAFIVAMLITYLYKKRSHL